MRYKVLRICQSDAQTVVPQEPVRFDLDRAAELLEGAGFLVTHSDVLVIAKRDRTEVTVYTNGRLMVQPTKDKEQAAAVADEIYSLIEGARERA